VLSEAVSEAAWLVAGRSFAVSLFWCASAGVGSFSRGSVEVGQSLPKCVGAFLWASFCQMRCTVAKPAGRGLTFVIHAVY